MEFGIGDLQAITACLYLVPSNPFHHPARSVPRAVGTAIHPNPMFRRNWVNFPLRDYMVRQMNRWLGGRKPDEARILDMHYRIPRDIYVSMLNRACIRRLRRGLTRHERARVFRIMDQMKRSLDRVLDGADADVIRYVVEHLPFEANATKKMFNIPYLLSRGVDADKTEARFTQQDRVILALLVGKVKATDGIVKRLLGDVTEVLDAPSLSAMMLIAFIPWLSLRMVVALSGASWISIEDSIQMRYAVFKLTQNSLTKLRNIRNDSNQTMLQKMINNLEIPLGDSQAAMGNVMQTLNEKRVRNKMESIVLAKEDSKLQERVNRAMDTTIKDRQLSAEVVARRREFYMWLFALIVVVLSTVFLIMTNGKEIYMIMAALLMIMVVLYAVVQWWRS